MCHLSGKGHPARAGGTLRTRTPAYLVRCPLTYCHKTHNTNKLKLSAKFKIRQIRCCGHAPPSGYNFSVCKPLLTCLLSPPEVHPTSPPKGTDDRTSHLAILRSSGVHPTSPPKGTDDSDRPTASTSVWRSTRPPRRKALMTGGPEVKAFNLPVGPPDLPAERH